MSNFGFIRVAAATPAVKVADCEFNTNAIIDVIAEADRKNVAAVVFPESSITSYSIGDLIWQRSVLDSVEESIQRICDFTKDKYPIVIVGAQLEIANSLYNAGVVIHRGEIKGAVVKTFMPNYREFYEKRWFASAAELSQSTTVLCGQEIPVGIDLIFNTTDFSFAIEVCEDLWTAIPPSSFHALHGAEVVFNLSASNELAGKNAYRRNLVNDQSSRCIGAYVYSSAGVGESTTDTVFSGHSIIAEKGVVLAESERFSRSSQLVVADVDVERLRNERLKRSSFTTIEYKSFLKPNYRYVNIKTEPREIDVKRRIERLPFLDGEGCSLDEHCKDVFAIQREGLAKRLIHTGIQNSIIGVSGGLDSTLALLVLVATYDSLGIDRKHIYGITMPGFGTSDRTYDNALALMKALGVTMMEIPIREAVIQHFKDIDHDISVHDVTYENSQARERTQILMDFSNKVNGLVVGTGDLSELALGWCTYNGDHMSMYSVNSGVSKTLVQAMVRWAAKNDEDKVVKALLEDIVDTPVSPELLPVAKDGSLSQKTEDSIGPYILHDFFIYNMLRYGFSPEKILFMAKLAFEGEYDGATILKWMKVFYKRFFTQQFKRSCMPDGPKVGEVGLSPRGDLRMSSDATYTLWMTQLDKLRP